MKMNRKILKVSSIYMIGTMFYRGIGFLTVPIYTRLLSTNDYGIINTYASWVSVLTVIFSLALYMGLRASFIDFEDKTKDVLGTIILFTIVYCGLIGSLSFLAIIILKIQVSKTLVICCLLNSTYGALINDYLIYLMMKKEYLKRVAFMVLPELFANIAAVVGIVRWTSDEKYLGKVIPTVSVYCIVSIIIICIALIVNRPKYSIKYLKYALTISIPLVFHGLSTYILSQSDRLMITSIRTASETGIYSLAYNVGMLTTAITFAFEGIYVPWFTDRMKEQNYEKINSLSSYYVKFISLVMSVIMMLAPEIIVVFSPEEYWEGKMIIPIIVMSNFFVFLYTLYVNIEHFHKKTKYIAINTIIAAFVNLILNSCFIPHYGYFAAAVTTLIAYTISMLMHFVYAKNLEKKLLNFKMFIPELVELMVISFLYYFVHEILVIRIVLIFVLFLLNYLSIRKVFSIKKLFIKQEKL